MTTTEAPRRPSRLVVVVNWTITLFVVFFLVVLLFLMWPMIQARLGQSGVTVPSLPTLPTAALSRPPAAAPASAPALNLEQISATSTTIYQATAAAVDAPPANQNNTGDSAPLMIEERPSVRQAAGENAPTAEPIAPGVDDGVFGSKQVLVNPQETHTCRHGQVWTDGKGCKNP